MKVKWNVGVKVCMMEVLIVNYCSDYVLRHWKQMFVLVVSWNAESSEECKVCDMHVEQSVSHLIVECMGYERERTILMNEV